MFTQERSSSRPTDPLAVKRIKEHDLNFKKKQFPKERDYYEIKCSRVIQKRFYPGKQCLDCLNRRKD